MSHFLWTVYIETYIEGILCSIMNVKLSSDQILNGFDRLSYAIASIYLTLGVIAPVALRIFLFKNRRFLRKKWFRKKYEVLY